MKLSLEQLAEWFFTANPRFPEEGKAKWLNALHAPPEDSTRSEIVSGMKQGINDTLKRTEWLPAAERRKIDEVLAAKGLPSLQNMETGLKKKHRHILARGLIKDDEEFYIVTGILSDLEFDVTDLERKSLQAMSGAYEAKKK